MYFSFFGYQTLFGKYLNCLITYLKVNIQIFCFSEIPVLISGITGSIKKTDKFHDEYAMQFFLPPVKYGFW